MWRNDGCMLYQSREQLKLLLSFLLRVDVVSGRVTGQSLLAHAPCVATFLGCIPHRHNVPLVCMLNMLRHARSSASAKCWYRKDAQQVTGPMVWPWFTLFFLGSSSWLHVLGHAWILLSLIDTTTSSVTVDSLLQADACRSRTKGMSRKTFSS